MKRILILGATSAIARAAARRWSEDGARFFLAARDPERLADTARELRARGASDVATHPFEATHYPSHPALLSAAWSFLDAPDVVLVAHGMLPDQQACAADSASARRAFEVNAVSMVSLLTEIANRMEADGRGCLAVLSSVAGDRGRASNYVYGSAKASVSTFVSGLRNRLHGQGVRVLDLRPGFVATPLTAHLPKSALFSSPEKAAGAIVRAVASKNGIVYVPGFWRVIMTAVRAIPDVVFRRMSL